MRKWITLGSFYNNELIEQRPIKKLSLACSFMFISGNKEISFNRLRKNKKIYKKVCLYKYYSHLTHQILLLPLSDSHWKDLLVLDFKFVYTMAFIYTKSHISRIFFYDTIIFKIFSLPQKSIGFSWSYF